MAEQAEVIDELAVAMWAEIVRPNGRFRDDMLLDPEALVSEVCG